MTVELSTEPIFFRDVDNIVRTHLVTHIFFYSKELRSRGVEGLTRTILAWVPHWTTLKRKSLPL